MLRITLKEFQKKIQCLLEQVSDSILESPDNPDVVRLNNSCYTINLSQLSQDKKLEPMYYDFKRQYQVIVKSLGNSPVFIDKLDKILNDGWLKDENYGKVVLHPTVISNVKNLINS